MTSLFALMESLALGSVRNVKSCPHKLFGPQVAEPLLQPYAPLESPWPPPKRGCERHQLLAEIIAPCIKTPGQRSV